MYAGILVIAVWAVAAVGIRIMRKIQPEDRLYPVWAVFICILLTVFVAWHESWLSVLPVI